MKPLKTKAQIRDEINEQINAFIGEGGAVNSIPRGISGREPTTTPPLPINFDREQQTRTPVQNVVTAIEARRHAKSPSKPHKRATKPRKKMIYDDFGQPLRWQWVED
ncbi:hypothetical protein QWY82_17275 [Simiduia curdlanivorans]|uniref:Transcriptional regulator SutA RNAP-binding domain-containing protein n=1 Tax=Simiduia curdlanivorans TaxID=1492769 RepID=A0ABV8V6L5_9GAMM|nr:hypothetical protein [Simiduia curdlanivorans]MDN3640552.1 hypothetical protein [Simiduia curdlanivorans]